MNLDEFIRNLEKLQAQIEPFHENLTRQLAVTGLSLIKNRIQLKEGLEGEVYSDAYANSREFKRLGKSKSKVNLTLTGKMMQNIRILRVEKKGDSKYVVFAGTTTEDEKFKDNQKRYGQFIRLNKDETQILTKSYINGYQRFFSNIV